MRFLNKLKGFVFSKWIIIPLYIIGYGISAISGVSCIFKHFLKIPCPGCGFTRALINAFKLDFSKAFYYHPMFWSFPILVWWFLFDGRMFKKRSFNIITCVVVLGGFLVTWIVRLIIGFDF